jgi:hypothetical protein
MSTFSACAAALVVALALPGRGLAADGAPPATARAPASPAQPGSPPRDGKVRAKAKELGRRGLLRGAAKAAVRAEPLVGKRSAEKAAARAEKLLDGSGGAAVDAAVDRAVDAADELARKLR